MATTQHRERSRSRAAGRAVAPKGAGKGVAKGTARSATKAATRKALSVHGKKALERDEERTRPGRFYLPDTDIYETDESLIVVMDVPGVSRDQVEVTVDGDLLSVEARVDLDNYTDLRPVYTEYNVGHFARRFTLGDRVDRDAIAATVRDGVLTIEIAKHPEARARRIPVE